MRGGLALTLGFSLGAHLLVAAALVAHGRRAAPPEALGDPRLLGETFELPAPEAANTSVVPIENGGAPPKPHEPPASRPSEARRSTRPASGPVSDSTRPASGPISDESGTTATPARYGAIGERSATDLATAFTRGFPQAASADPIWPSTPIGSAGEADVVLTLNDSGHIEAMQILGAPSPALRNAIQRTRSLLASRPFVAKSKQTTLHLVATVTTDAVHDGLHGDVFAIGGSFAGGEGNAFFALAIGRRIDVRIRAK